MEFRANEGKSVTIEVNGKTYARHAIQSHFASRMNSREGDILYDMQME